MKGIRSIATIAILLFFCVVPSVNGELGSFVKSVIESFGREVTSVYFPELTQLKQVFSVGKFELTGVLLQRISTKVDYSVSADAYTFKVLIPNPQIVLEVNNKSYNPEILISNLSLTIVLDKKVRICRSVTFHWDNITLDVGFISNFLPDKLLNNDWVAKFLKQQEVPLQNRITQMLLSMPVQLFPENGQIVVNLNKIDSLKNKYNSNRRDDL